MSNTTSHRAHVTPTPANTTLKCACGFTVTTEHGEAYGEYRHHLDRVAEVEA